MQTKSTHDRLPEVVDGIAVTYRPIDRFPAYLFGDDGSVWSRAYKGRLCARWRRLTGRTTNKGYRAVSLRQRDGSLKDMYVQRLILEAFVGPSPLRMEACHDPDPDRTNNRLCNLRWDTRSANLIDAVKIGRKSSKLSTADVHEARRLHGEGWNYPKIARRFNVSRASARRACVGSTWSHVPGQIAPAYERTKASEL